MNIAVVGGCGAVCQSCELGKPVLYVGDEAPYAVEVVDGVQHRFSKDFKMGCSCLKESAAHACIEQEGSLGDAPSVRSSLISWSSYSPKIGSLRRSCYLYEFAVSAHPRILHQD